MLTLNLRSVDGDTSQVSLPDPTVTSATQRGLITAFNPATDNWQQPNNVVIDGQQFFVETANKAWSFTKLDDYKIRFELRAGEVWADDETSRSEILTIRNVDNNSVFGLSFNMLIEPGVVETDLDWRSCLQMHDGPNPIISLSILHDRMNVLVNQAQSNGSQPYADTVPLQRGHLYAMRLEGRLAPDATGYLKIWRDGVQIVDYIGPVGAGEAAYWKFGIYQGWPVNVSNTIAIQYSNIALDYTDPPPPPPPPPLPPGINKVGVTTIATTVDDGNAGEILGQKVVLSTAATLQSLSFYLGTAAGNIRLGLYRDNNGRPSTKIAETASSTAVVGWNTKPVLTQVALQPGTYWMAFELSSNAALSRLTGSGTGIWNGGQAYGTLPATFPGSQPTFNDSWSFYMTVNV